MTSIFSFSHNVFKSPFFPGSFKKSGLNGKALNSDLGGEVGREKQDASSRNIEP